jgi:hypothetical protein
MKPKVAFDYSTNRGGVTNVAALSFGMQEREQMVQKTAKCCCLEHSGTFYGNSWQSKLGHLHFRMAPIKGLLEPHGPALP